MHKRDFLYFLSQKMATDLRDVYGDRVSVDQASKALDCVFSAIVEVVAQGDEVRVIPVGRFYPKMIRRAGKTPNMKIGFASYRKMDEWLTKTLARIAPSMFKVGDAQKSLPATD